MPNHIVRRLPNLLVIGAQKCGTTWLYEQLRRHPYIYFSEIKELSFFGKRESNRDLEAYGANFTGAGNERYVAEATPGYFWSRDSSRKFFGSGPRQLRLATPQAVRETLGPDVKLILSLRHPVHRSVSAFMHHFRRGRIKPEDRITDLLERLVDFEFRFGIIEMGFYQRHFLPWERVFGPNKILTLFTDDIRSDPVSALGRVAAFLDLPPGDIDGADETIHSGPKLAISDNALTIDATDPRTRKMLRENNQGKAFPRISRDEILELQEIYTPDIAFIEQRFRRPDLGWHIARQLEDFVNTRSPAR